MTRALLIAAALALSGGGAWLADRYRAAHHRADEAERTAAELARRLENTRTATVTVTEYVDRVQTIRVKGDTLIKEIPRYVSVPADAACPIPVGFVRLHDAAAAGTLPDPDPGDADAAASGLALSAVAATVAGNYTDSLANSEQLTRLQQTLRDQGVTIIGDPAAMP